MIGALAGVLWMLGQNLEHRSNDLPHIVQEAVRQAGNALQVGADQNRQRLTQARHGKGDVWACRPWGESGTMRICR